MSTVMRSGIIKTLGGIGYVSIVFQWLQVGVAWLPGFFDSKLGKIIFPQSHTAPSPVTHAGTGGTNPDFVTTFLVTALAVAALGFVTYVVVVRYTRAIRKTGSQVTHVVAKKATRIVTHKPLEQLPPRKRTLLTRRLLFWTKIAFALVPLLVLPLVLHDGERGVIEQLALFIQAVLATIAVLSFFVQAVFAARWHERVDDIE